MAASDRDDDDEEAERKLQQEQRRRLSLTDRLHGGAKPTTASGFVDMRSFRRTGRVVQFSLRVHPRVRAMVDAIMRRDGYPSAVVLFEEMLAAYCKIHGALDEKDLPSDEQLVECVEAERDKRDGQ